MLLMRSRGGMRLGVLDCEALIARMMEFTEDEFDGEEQSVRRGCIDCSCSRSHFGYHVGPGVSPYTASNWAAGDHELHTYREADTSRSRINVVRPTTLPGRRVTNPWFWHL
jgi:hypothetical protein